MWNLEARYSSSLYEFFPNWHVPRCKWRNRWCWWKRKEWETKRRNCKWSWSWSNGPQSRNACEMYPCIRICSICWPPQWWMKVLKLLNISKMIWTTSTLSLRLPPDQSIWKGEIDTFHLINDVVAIFQKVCKCDLVMMCNIFSEVVYKHTFLPVLEIHKSFYLAYFNTQCSNFKIWNTCLDSTICKSNFQDLQVIFKAFLNLLVLQGIPRDTFFL